MKISPTGIAKSLKAAKHCAAQKMLKQLNAQSNIQSKDINDNMQNDQCQDHQPNTSSSHISKHASDYETSAKVSSCRKGFDFKANSSSRIKNPIQDECLKRLRNVIDFHIKSFAEQIELSTEEYLLMVNCWQSGSSMFEAIELWLLSALQKDLEKTTRAALQYVTAFLVRSNGLTLDKELETLIHEANEFSFWLPLFSSEIKDEFQFLVNDDWNTYELNCRDALVIHKDSRFSFAGKADETTERYYLVSQWTTKTTIQLPPRTLQYTDADERIHRGMRVILTCLTKENVSNWNLDDCIFQFYELMESESLLDTIVDKSELIRILFAYFSNVIARRKHQGMDCKGKIYILIRDKFLKPVLKEISFRENVKVEKENDCMIVDA